MEYYWIVDQMLTIFSAPFYGIFFEGEVIDYKLDINKIKRIISLFKDGDTLNAEFIIKNQYNVE